MTPRQIRRAAERATRKQERKAENGFVFSPPDVPIPSPERAGPSVPVARVPEQSSDRSSPTISPSQLAANRANSQLSTGPKTPAGKAKSSHNAVKTALTGRTVLLPTDDAAAYEEHVADFFHELRPLGTRESALVQLLADNSWRLDRVFALEMGIYALGRAQFADHFSAEDPALQPNLVEVHTFLAYEKQLRNLQLQFARLCRQREKDTAELHQLQQERIKREKQQLETGAKLYTAKHDRQPFDPAEYGLDCSIEDIECYLKGVRAANLLNPTLKQERDQARSRASAA
ncbi:MAG: hypothetical protein ACR2JB_19880 [Bryobacteraceae bacterium]